MERSGVKPQFPECTNAYMLEFLFEVGPTHEGAPITFVEIESWQRTTGVELSYWEARTLHRLSREYVVQLHKSTYGPCPAPYQMDIEDQRKVVESKFRAFLSNSRVTRE